MFDYLLVILILPDVLYFHFIREKQGLDVFF